MTDNVLGEAILRLKLDSTGMTAGAVKANSALKQMTMTVVSSALGFGGAMGLASMVQRTTQAFVGSGKELIAYQKNMAEVSTLVDTTKVNMDDLAAGVDKLSSKWGTQQGGLAKALYQTISASIDASKATQFLDTAVEASIGGVTTATVAVDGLTSVINAYGLAVEDAGDVSDSFFVAVKDGKTTFEELAGGIGSVVSIAASLDVNIDTLLSSVAALTLSGQSTSEAFTGMRGMFTAILKPADEAKEIAKLLGIELGAVAVKAKGLPAFLEEVKQKTAGSETALAKLFPEVRGLNAVMKLVSDQGGKDFNRILDDSKDKMNAASEAAEKMKDTLSFKWDKTVQDTKLAMQDIVKSVTPAIEKLLEFTNAWGEGKAMLRSGEETPLQMYQRDPNQMSVEQLNSLIRSQEVMIENNQKAMQDVPALSKQYEKQIWQANELIQKANELIATKKEEAGYNQQFADRAKQGQIEAEARAKAESEAEKKRLEAEKKRVDALIRNKDEEKKNAEIAKDNAALLTKLDEDRLTVASRLASMKEGINQLDLKGKKETAESNFKYDQLVYESQAEHLEAIASDESKSVAVRKKANDDLYILKIHNAEATKDYEMKMLQLQGEADVMENDQRVRAIEEYRADITKAYEDTAKAIKNSQLNDKEERLKNLGEEHSDRVSALKNMQVNNDKTFRAIEARGQLAAKNIDQDFKNALGTEVSYKVKADIELELSNLFDDDSTSIFNGLITQYNELKEALDTDRFGENARANIEKEMKKIQMTMAVEVSSLAKRSLSFALDTMLSETNATIGEVTKNLGELISSIGDASKNVFIKVAGEAIGFIGGFSDFIERYQNRQEEYEKKQLKLIDNMNSSIDKSIAKTREWLIEIGKMDRSNLSYSELVDQRASVYQKGASELSGILGTDTLNATDFKSIYESVANSPDAISGAVGVATMGTMQTYEQYKTLTDTAKGKTFYVLREFIKDEASDLYKTTGDVYAYKKTYEKYGINALDMFPMNDRGNLLAGGPSKVEPGNYEELLINNVVSEDVFNAALKIAKESDTGELSIEQYLSGISDVVQGFSGAIEPLSQQIQAYGQQTGLDYTKSMTKDDFIADIEALKEIGSISESQYYKDLYEYSNGLKPHVNNASMWFSEYEKKLYKKNYEDFLTGGKGATSGIIGLASGGIAMTPTFATIAEGGKPEAVIPLERMPEMAAMFSRGGSGGSVGQITVTNLIDPNIPITQDTARYYSEQIGESIRQTLRARGI